MSSYSNYLRSYTPKGKTPVVKMKAKCLSINTISSISKLGKMRVMTYTETLKTNTLVKFLRRLCKDTDKKIIIMDNLAVHHSNKLMRWGDVRKHKIAVFYLPTYSPELNPDERLNLDLKTHFHSGITAADKTKLKRKESKITSPLL